VGGLHSILHRTLGEVNGVTGEQIGSSDSAPLALVTGWRFAGLRSRSAKLRYMACWAEPIGGCSDKMSREHLISAAVFPGKMIMVQGFPWCKDTPKEIGLASLTSKILCDKHNSDLSPLDAAAGESAETLRAMEKLGEIRSKLKQNYWNVQKFELNGALMERWFLKTLINIACGKDYSIGRDSDVAGRPSPRLVRIAYGQEKFEDKAGLYFAVKVGMTLTMEDRVQCVTSVKENRIEGAFFNFRGFGFLLFLEAEGPPESFAGISFGGQDLSDMRPLFRDSSFTTKFGRYRSHTLKIKW